jgi:hypothetical protein
MNVPLRCSGGAGAGRRAAVLVVVAEHELARAQRAPGHPPVGCGTGRSPRRRCHGRRRIGTPCPGPRGGDAGDRRLPEAVGEAEVLAARRSSWPPAARAGREAVRAISRPHAARRARDGASRLARES